MFGDFLLSPTSAGQSGRCKIDGRSTNLMRQDLGTSVVHNFIKRSEMETDLMPKYQIIIGCLEGAATFLAYWNWLRRRCGGCAR